MSEREDGKNPADEPKEVLMICPLVKSCKNALEVSCSAKYPHNKIKACSEWRKSPLTEEECPPCIPYQPEASKETTKPEPTGYDEKAHEKKIDKCYDCHYLISDTGRCEHCKDNDLFVQKEPTGKVLEKAIGEILKRFIRTVKLGSEDVRELASHPVDIVYTLKFDYDQAVTEIVELFKREGI